MPQGPQPTVGKKSKVGKGRLDTFYHLAKEHGYRSRASFKLIQLNKKYGFLDKSSSLVDLCAAPGGWLQVAQKHMPADSVIIGVDLQDIKPIRGVISFTDDITKPSCLKTIQENLKGGKVDVVLHDGAPNMGTAWSQDAYSQVDLTLKSARLATKVLKKGGWFVTKVFRSEDYNSLLWVFNQLFTKVDATKPMASRATSAEIYVVCKGYLAPTKMDPKLLDSRFVFKQDEQEKRISLNVLTSTKKNRSGYSTDGSLLFKSISINEFVTTDDPVQMLATHNTMVFDAECEKFANHPSTTELIKVAFKDLKVISKHELKNLLKWRTVMRSKVLGADDKPEKAAKEKEEQYALQLQEVVLTKKKKRERKKELMGKRKMVKRIELGIEAQQGDKLVDEQKLFSTETLADLTDKDLKEIADAKIVDDLGKAGSDSDDSDEVVWSDESETDSENEGQHVDRLERDIDLSYRVFLMERNKTDRKSLVEKDKFDRESARTGHVYNSDEEDKEMLADDEEEQEGSGLLKTSKKNPLLMEETTPKKKQIDMWFDQDIFKGLSQDNFDDPTSSKKRALEIDEGETKRPTKKSKNTDQVVPDASVPNGKQVNGKQSKQANGVQNGKHVDGDDDEIPAKGKASKSKSKEAKSRDAKESKPKEPKNGFEVVPAEPDMDSDDERLDEDFGGEGLVADEADLDEADQISDDEGDIDSKVQTLAIGAKLIRKKSRQSIEDNMFSRYTFNDEDLPEWFSRHEAKYIKPNLPITKEDIAEMRRVHQEINARPIKKVAEARARKKYKDVKKTSKAREKAHAIAQDDSLSAGQKISQVNRIMKKVNQKQGREKVYVVAKAGTSTPGKKRKHAKNARVKLVDSRMKKESRARKRMVKDGRVKLNKPAVPKGGRPKTPRPKGKSATK